MTDIALFQASHAVQLGALTLAPEEHWEAIAQSEMARTVFHNGIMLGCGGFVNAWPGRVIGWVVLSPDLRPRDFIRVHRIVRRILKDSEFERVEAHIVVDFEEGHRWARLLGFEEECPRMRSFFPDGQDAAMYVLVRAGRWRSRQH